MPKPILRHRSAGLWLWLISGLVLLGTSCRGGRLLDDDQYLVRRNRVELVKGAHVEEWSSYASELYNLIEPQKNGRLFFLFRRERIYLRSIAKDSTRYRGFVRRIIAERPAFLDTQLVETSARRIKTYMLNRGYFDAEVDFSIDTMNRQAVRVEYLVAPGKAYRFDTVKYQTANAGIAALVDKNREARMLRAGVRVDSRFYDQEVLRLVSLMRNNGYADFYANSISQIEADSTGGSINAALRILPPAEGQMHRVYRVGQVTVFPDTDPLTLSQTVGYDTLYDGLRFIYESDDLKVLPPVLADNIFIRPGQQFDQSSITQTNLQLNLLGVFRLVNVQQVPSADAEDEIDFLIECTPAKRRGVFGEPNINFTDRQFGGSNLALIGLQLSGGLTDNNVFRGAEKLTVGLDAGVEFNVGRIQNPSLQRLNTLELGLQAGLELPRFFDYFGIYRSLHRFRSGTDDDGEPIHFISDDFYQALRESALTRIQLGARYTSQLILFDQTSLSGTFGYTLNKAAESWTINHLGLEYFEVSARPAFQVILDQSPFLQRSFGDQVFSAFLLRSISYARYKTREPSQVRHTWLVDFEQSGAEVLSVNAITNSLTKADGPYSLGPGLDYARYGRLQVSHSQSRPIDFKQDLAWRLLSGAALTFGYDRSQRDVPYLRQFFVGGSNSMRGWVSRDLGPGGYFDSTRTGNLLLTIPYQQADFRLEANVELRGPLGSVSSTRVSYAVFVDAGNIWTLRRDPSRPLSQFAFTEKFGEDGQLVAEPFYRQVAINTGLGIRWDVQYFLIRFDVGVKLRSPYAIDGTHWPSRFDTFLNGRFGYGLGLSLPF